MSDDATIQLVRAAQKGDHHAMEELFRRYLPRVQQIVAMRLGYRLKDFATYEDLVQDVMVRVFENLEMFTEISEGTFRNWVAACVVNSVKSYFRDRNAKKRGAGRLRNFGSYQSEDLSSILFPAKDPTPSKIVLGKELLERIESALLELTEQQREAIILRRFCELSYAELAKTLDLKTETNARQTFHRAMTRLLELSGIEDVSSGNR